MKGVRSFVLLLLAGCASRSGALEAHTTAAPVPGYRSHAPRPPSRTHLEIPEEYVGQLNWDPAAFENAPILFDADDSPRIERSPSLPARFRVPRTRPARYRAERPFRTTGIRVSISPASGHPMGRSGQPVGRPAQAVTRPGQAVNQPGQAVKRPAQAVERPGQAVERPEHPVKRPGHAVKRSKHPVKRPDHAVKRPGQAVKRSGHPVKRPGQAVDPVPEGDR
jgi:hypothetical protein